MSAKIIIKHENSLFNFLSFILEKNDGSFYITLLREGENNHYIKYTTETLKPEKVVLENNRLKRKKISYHSSGLVIYHNVHQHSNYYEPLSSITQNNLIAQFIIPSVHKLDTFSGVPEEQDYILNLDFEISKPILFSFIISPINYEVSNSCISVKYENLFYFIIETISIDIDPNLKEYFSFLTPNKGLFDEQQISKEQALINFHKKINNSNNLIIYLPNNEGIYTVIFSVLKRCPPRVKIQFEDSSYSFEVVSKNTNILKFKIKDKYGNTVKKLVDIIKIELDSEL